MSNSSAPKNPSIAPRFTKTPMPRPQAAAAPAAPAAQVSDAVSTGESAISEETIAARLARLEAENKALKDRQKEYTRKRAKWWIGTSCYVVNGECIDCGQKFPQFFKCRSQRNKNDTYQDICKRKENLTNAAAAAKAAMAAARGGDDDAVASMLSLPADDHGDAQSGTRRARVEEEDEEPFQAVQE
jgi:hypothetical protein